MSNMYIYIYITPQERRKRKQAAYQGEDDEAMKKGQGGDRLRKGRGDAPPPSWAPAAAVEETAAAEPGAVRDRGGS